MSVKNKTTWGRWTLQNSSLVTTTFAGYTYHIPVKDIQDERMFKVWLGQLSVKRWISTQDLFDFRQACRELGGVTQ
jgi:hypothetical protein